MESIIVFMVSIAVIIVSVVTMTMNTIQSTAKLSSSWKAVEQRASTIQRTMIVSVPPQSYSGGIIDIVVKNEGQVNVNEFTHWDVIIEEQDGSSLYLTYVPSYPPAPDEWAVKGIFITDNVSEKFDLNILNPGEQVIVGISPGGLIEIGKTVKITISTADGITSQCYVTEQAP